MKAYKHILLATDFSKSSEKAARRAVRLAGCSDAKINLLHVIEYFLENRKPTQSVIGKNREQLEQLSKHIEYQSAILLERVSRGPANDEIIRVANEIKADLIVIAACHKKNLTKLAAGSTTKKVVDNAPCDVLVVSAQRRLNAVTAVIA